MGIELVSLFLILVALLMGWLGARWVVSNATRLALVDAPEHRSSHTQPTPTGGGIGMVFGAAASMATLAWLHSEPVLMLAAALALLLALAGLADDRTGLSPKLRLLIQFAVLCGLLAWMSPLPALTLPFTMSVSGAWLLVVGMLAALWWVNLFNFMDGIDGLAAAQAIFMLLAASLLAWLAQPHAIYYPIWRAMLMTAAAVQGFLILNWPPARVFMGDTGSLFLGFIMVFFGLATVSCYWMNYPAWMILGALFITDATVTLVVRLLQGQRPPQAHRSHAYQRLARRWGTHRPVTLLYMGINLLWLFPLAGIALFKPTYAWLAVAVAYAPLLAAAIWLGAGRQDHA